MIIYLQLCFNLCKLNESFKKTDPDLLHRQDYSSGYNSSFSATIFSPPHNHLLLTSSSPLLSFSAHCMVEVSRSWAVPPFPSFPPFPFICRLGDGDLLLEELEDEELEEELEEEEERLCLLPVREERGGEGEGEREGEREGELEEERRLGEALFRLLADGKRLLLGEGNLLLHVDGDFLLLGEGDLLFLGDGDLLLLGDGDRLFLGDGDLLRLGDADLLFLGEGDLLYLGDGDLLLLGEGVLLLGGGLTTADLTAGLVWVVSLVMAASRASTWAPLASRATGPVGQATTGGR